MINFIVALGYRKFIFRDKHDAVSFAETARLHSEEDNLDITISVVIHRASDPANEEPEND